MASVLKCNNCNIVVDELLTFVQNKIDVMDEESLCKICVSAFSSDVIVRSKALLFESLPAKSRKINRKKEGKQRRDIEDIISLYKATDPEQIPVFVARDLHKLPPVTFDHIDITDLLKKINVLRAEMNEIKSSYIREEQLQEVKNHLKLVESRQNTLSDTGTNGNYFLNVNTKRGAYLDSGPVDISHYESSPPSQSDVTDNAECQNHYRTPCAEMHGQRTSSPSLVCVNVSRTHSVFESDDNNLNQPVSQQANEGHYSFDQLSDDKTLKSNSSKLPKQRQEKSMADIVKGGEWKLVQSKKTKKRISNRFIGQTGKANSVPEDNFKAAEIKIPILITNVHKDSSSENISKYIQNRTGEKVNLLQINIKNSRKEYNAYKLYIPKRKLPIFLDDSLWPSGIIFRQFMPRVPNYLSGGSMNHEKFCDI